MKRKKVMLTAIAILAIIGGALAFKVKHFGIWDYCYVNTTAANAACPFAITDRIFVGGNQQKYTTTNNPNRCAELLPTQCTSIGVLGGI